MQNLIHQAHTFMFQRTSNLGIQHPFTPLIITYCFHFMSFMFHSFLNHIILLPSEKLCCKSSLIITAVYISFPLHALSQPFPLLSTSSTMHLGGLEFTSSKGHSSPGPSNWDAWRHFQYGLRTLMTLSMVVMILKENTVLKKYIIRHGHTLPRISNLLITNHSFPTLQRRHAFDISNKTYFF